MKATATICLVFGLLVQATTSAQSPKHDVILIGEAGNDHQMQGAAYGADDGVTLFSTRWDTILWLEDAMDITSYSFTDGLLWTRQVSPALPGLHMKPERALRMADGGSLVLGHVVDELGNVLNFFLYKLDAEGELEDVITFQPTNVEWITSYFRGSSMHQLPDGRVIVSLSMYSKPVVIMLEQDLSIAWCKSFTSTQDPSDKNPPFDFALLDDGSFLLTEKAGGDPFLVNVDANGEVQWAQRYGNGMDYYHTKTVVQLANGDLMIGGYRDYAPFMARLDATGNVLWARVVDGSVGQYDDGIKSIVELSNGDILIGTQGELPTYSGYTGCIMLDPQGEVLQAWCGSGENFNGYGLVAGAGEQVVMVGVSFPEQLGTNGEYDEVQHVFRFDPRTDPLCLFQPDNTASTALYTLPAASTSGSTEQTEPLILGTMDLVVAALSYTSHAGCDLTTAIPPPIAYDGARITPTMVEQGGTVQVVASGTPDRWAVEVVDAAGRSVQREPMILPTTLLHLNEAPGTYVVVVRDAAQRIMARSKVVVE